MRHIACEAVVVNYDGKKMGRTRTGFSVFVCPHCDNTHIEFIVDGGVKFCLVWDPKDAEKLAEMLVNPEPIPEHDTGTIKR